MKVLATRQHGVVTRWQLASLGFGVKAIEAALGEGRLSQVHEEVFAVGHTRVSQRGQWWAAVLAYGPDAVLSHQSGAVLWELRRRRRGPIHVTAALGRQGVRRRRGIWIHRCKLRAEETTVHEGIRVTTVGRTLFDLAEVAPYEEVKKAAEAADRRNLLRLRELEEVCERGNGRRALRPVHRLLVELGAPAEGRSPLEIRFAKFLHARRIPAPAQNVDVLGHEVDALSPAAKLMPLTARSRRDWRRPRVRLASAGPSGARTQGGRIAALFGRLRTPHRAVSAAARRVRGICRALL